MAAQSDKPILTTRQGHPVQNSQQQRTVGSNTPESMHMLTWLFSPRGIPKDYRHLDGFGVNTYRWVNAAGEGVLVKYHWKAQQGVESMTAVR